RPDRQPRREPAAHAERHPHAAAGRRRAVLPQPHVPSPSPGRWAGARSSPSGPAPGAARTATREPARPAPEALALPYEHPRRTVHPCPPPAAHHAPTPAHHPATEHEWHGTPTQTRQPARTGDGPPARASPADLEARPAIRAVPAVAIPGVRQGRSFIVSRPRDGRRPGRRPPPPRSGIAGGGRPPADVGRRPLLWPGWWRVIGPCRRSGCSGPGTRR